MITTRLLIIVTLMSHQCSSSYMGVLLYITDLEINEQLLHHAEKKDDMLFKNVMAFNGVLYYFLEGLQHNYTESCNVISNLFSQLLPVFLHTYRNNSCIEKLLKIYKWNEKEYSYFNSFIMNTINLLDIMSVLIKQITNQNVLS